MSTHHAHKLRQRRAKLAALAERGEQGERDNAKRKLAEFDARHPQLERQPLNMSEVAQMDVRATVVNAGPFYNLTEGELRSMTDRLAIKAGRAIADFIFQYYMKQRRR